MTDRHRKALQLIDLADSLRQKGEVTESLQAAHEAIQLMESAKEEGKLDEARQLHAAYGVLAVTLAQHDKQEESVAWFEKAIAVYKEEHISGGDHRDLAQLSSLRHNYAVTLQHLNHEQAAAQLEMAVALKEKLVAECPDDARYKANLVRTYLSISHDLDREVAMSYLNRSFALLTELTKNDPQEREYVWMMGQCAGDLGDALQKESLEQAIVMYTASLSAISKAGKMEGGFPQFLLPMWISVQTKLGECLLRQDQFDHAIELLKNAVSTAQNIARKYPSLDPTLLDHTNAQLHLGRCYAMSQQYDEAVVVAEELAGGDDARSSYCAARILSLCAHDPDQGPVLQDKAIQLLNKCFSGGYLNTQAHFDQLNQEPDFSAVSDSPEFQHVIERMSND